MTGEELKQQIALYESADHTVHLDVKVDEDTVWLNRQQLALLFGRDIKTIGKHVGNALREELNGFSVVAKFATTASDGKTYQVEHYNLDMILSVGYRVKSKEGIYFRRWANSVLKQHLVDGYTINRKRLDALHAVVKVLSRSTEPESVSGSIPCQKIIECGITAGKAPVVDADARRSYGGAFPKRGLHEVWDGTRIRPFSARRPTALAMNGCG